MYLVKLVILMNLITFTFSPTPIKYYEESMIINDKPQIIHTIDVNMNSPYVNINNALSFNKIYGFEKTSTMVKDQDALVGINGMFYDTYGRHIGCMIENGEIISLPSEQTPVVLIDYDGNVTIEDLKFQGEVKGETRTLMFNSMNHSVIGAGWALLTPVYGRTTRVHRNSFNIVISEGVVSDILTSDKPVAIPENGYVLTYVTEEELDIPFKKGEKLEINYKGYEHINNIQEAFQSGGWLVKDNVNVAKDFEPLIGNTNIPSPRTILGITKDNHLIIKVIDGRQPGKSVGITGDEAAELMKDSGCIQAIYLDGGASSTLVIKDKIVNTPSNKGVEREVAHSLLIKLQINKKIFHNYQH